MLLPALPASVQPARSACWCLWCRRGSSCKTTRERANRNGIGVTAWPVALLIGWSSWSSSSRRDSDIAMARFRSSLSTPARFSFQHAVELAILPAVCRVRLTLKSLHDFMRLGGNTFPKHRVLREMQDL